MPTTVAVAKDHTVHKIGCPALSNSPGCTCPKVEQKTIAYPVADVLQLEGLNSHQTGAFAEAIRANSQVQIQFAPKSPS